MSRRILGQCLLIISLLVYGCGSPKPDDLIKQSIHCWEEAAEILEGVSDDATLRAADGKLETLAQKMVELNKKAAGQELQPEEKSRLETANFKESKAALKRYTEAEKQVRGMPGGVAVLTKFRRMSSRAF